MEGYWKDSQPVGKTVSWDKHTGVVMAVVQPYEDIRKYLGRRVTVAPDKEHLSAPVKARISSEAARLLVYCVDENKWYTPRRKHVEGL